MAFGWGSLAAAGIGALTSGSAAGAGSKGVGYGIADYKKAIGEAKDYETEQFGESERGLTGARDYAVGEDERALGQTEAGFDPYAQAGKAGLEKYSSLLDQGPVAGPDVPEYEKYKLDDFEGDPGYQFRLQQGTEATTRALSKSGQAFGGQRGIALQEYAQGFASNEYDRAFKRGQGEHRAEYEGAYRKGIDEYSARFSGRGRQLAGYGSLAETGYGAERDLAGAREGSAIRRGGIYQGTADSLARLREGMASRESSRQTGFGGSSLNARSKQGEYGAAGILGAGKAIQQGISAFGGMKYGDPKVSNTPTTPGWGI